MSKQAVTIVLKPGESFQILAGEVTLLVSRHAQSDDVHLYVEPKRTLSEIAIIPRTLKAFVLRAIQKVL